MTDDHYELWELRGAHSVSPFIVEEVRTGWIIPQRLVHSEEISRGSGKQRLDVRG